MRRLNLRLPLVVFVWLWILIYVLSVAEAAADFVPIYRGGICVANASGTCVGGDIRAEAGLGAQVGYMKTTSDLGTVPIYRSTCYSDTGGSCTAWGLSLDVSGTPVGYLSTTAPDTQSANAPLVQSNGMLLQNLGGSPAAYLWTTIPPTIASLSPTSGPVATPVTITGNYFGASQGTSTVTFIGVTAAISSWSNTSIVAPVPTNAVTGPVVVTVAGSVSNSVTFTVSGGGGSSPTKLVVTSVNSGNNPTAGAAFPVVVQAQDNGGVGRNVLANTGVTLSLETGTGVLAGTLTGTISAGTNQVTMSAATYTKAESGIIITASRSSGDSLASGSSAGFTVNPGAASVLAFTTQPGNSTAASSIAGPPTVAVRDNLGNSVTSSTASITLAIASNPGGGVLSGTTNRNASVGVAAFAGLSINNAGNGYTLSATSAGLTGATSSAFNVTGTGGTISGIITRVSNGTAVSGALVQAYQGTMLMGSATTNASGNYSISGLSSGIYTVQASFIGFVPQIRSGVTVSSGSVTTVNLALNVGIAIHSPISGTVINDHSVLVTGMFDTSLGEVGINVNGYVALQDGNEFATSVPLSSQTTTLIATVTNTLGTALASHTIPITVQLPTTEPVLTFRASPAIALVAEPVGFTLTSLNEISQIELDGNGDGTTDFTGTTLQGVTVTFADPGIYFPTVKVTHADSSVYMGSAIVQIVDDGQLDVLLRAKWNAMKNALRSGDTAGAANYILTYKRVSYQMVFNNLTIPLSSIDQMLTNITYIGVQGLNVEYEMLRNEPPDGDVSYMVLFALDTDGVWRISFF